MRSPWEVLPSTEPSSPFGGSPTEVLCLRLILEQMEARSSSIFGESRFMVSSIPSLGMEGDGGSASHRSTRCECQCGRLDREHRAKELGQKDASVARSLPIEDSSEIRVGAHVHPTLPWLPSAVNHKIPLGKPSEALTSISSPQRGPPELQGSLISTHGRSLIGAYKKPTILVSPLLKMAPTRGDPPPRPLRSDRHQQGGLHWLQSSDQHPPLQPWLGQPRALGSSSPVCTWRGTPLGILQSSRHSVELSATVGLMIAIPLGPTTMRNSRSTFPLARRPWETPGHHSSTPVGTRRVSNQQTIGTHGNLTSRLFSAWITIRKVPLAQLHSMRTGRPRLESSSSAPSTTSSARSATDTASPPA